MSPPCVSRLGFRSRAGEKAYNANQPYNNGLFSGNPYQLRVMSPYFGNWSGGYGPQRASPRSHATWINQTIALNNSLNQEAQRSIDGKEPKVDIWSDGGVDEAMSKLALNGKNGSDSKYAADSKHGYDRKGGSDSKGPAPSPAPLPPPEEKHSKMSSFRKSFGIKTGEERKTAKVQKAVGKGEDLKNSILQEENARWPDGQWRKIVAVYQEKTGMSKKIAHLRAQQPIQYLHLLRAGYFEPIPVAWAAQASNPLKFSIEASEGWRGITPAWRGYEDTAEERLYWVLNHREGSTGTRLKPDFISALDMARARMAMAVPPPPQYYDASDTCHTQHTTDGYSKQVMPPPFRAFDKPETANDDTMILLDVSGSMDFTPQRPNYDRYLITGYQNTNQPKNKGG